MKWLKQKVTEFLTNMTATVRSLVQSLWRFDATAGELTNRYILVALIHGHTLKEIATLLKISMRELRERKQYLERSLRSHIHGMMVA